MIGNANHSDHCTRDSNACDFSGHECHDLEIISDIIRLNTSLLIDDKQLDKGVILLWIGEYARTNCQKFSDYHTAIPDRC